MRPRDPDALLGFLAERACIPFAWGRHANDCVGFVLDAVTAQNGRRILRGVEWRDEREAEATIARLGGLRRAFSRRFRRIAPAAGLRGDIAAIADARFGISMVLIEGATLVGPGRHGLKRLPRAAMTQAWSIDV